MRAIWLIIAVTSVQGVAQSPSGTEPSDPASRALIAQARDDLAHRLRVATDEVRLISFAAVSWPNSALGCPRRGMGYLQVPQDGVQIRLEVNG